MIFKEEQKTQPIERSEVWEAFKRVKAGGKSPGIDGVTIAAVAGNPSTFQLWNRLAAEAITPGSQTSRILRRWNQRVLMSDGWPGCTDGH
jgi:hypothetical protein